jgi:hypothetical protein
MRRVFGRVFHRVFLGAVLSGGIVGCAFSRAGVAVYEGFNYASSADILVTSGGSGFTHEWKQRSSVVGGGSGTIPAGSVQLLPSSLAYTDTAGNVLQTAGGALFLTGASNSIHIARTFDAAALPNHIVNPPVGATTYASFLGRRSGAAADPNNPVYGGNYPWGSNLYPRTAGVTFWSDDNGDGVPMHVGNLSNVQEDLWTLNGQDLDDDPPQALNAPFGAGSLTYFIVFKFEHGTGDGDGDQVQMYVNPLLGSEGQNVPDAIGNWEKDDDPLHMPGRWFSVEAGDGSGNRPFAEFSLDELRIGATWSDVTPQAVPEPSALCLSALALSFVLTRRTRR